MLGIKESLITHHCCLFILAVRGYFTLSHSNIDKTGTIAVGGMTGTQFSTKYKERCDSHRVRSYIY